MVFEDFHEEISRGCDYTVIAKRAHNPLEFGLIQEPSHNEYRRGIRIYKTVPVGALKPEVFPVEIDEPGQLIDIRLSQDSVASVRVKWKNLIQVYYNDPISIRMSDEKISLDQLFYVIKTYPEETNKPQQPPDYFYEF